MLIMIPELCSCTRQTTPTVPSSDVDHAGFHSFTGISQIFQEDSENLKSGLKKSVYKPSDPLAKLLSPFLVA